LLNSDHNSAYAQNLLITYDVKARHVTTAIHELSGGNQQKFIVGRELSRNPRILLAIQPTRGVDIGSTEYIHQKLLEQRDQGVGILLISTELDEIFALSDRIGVMHKGKIVDILPADKADRETIGLMMTGAK
jgi:simple sugar transport system ATP-binding protein